jgi:hypothetical protein
MKESELADEVKYWFSDMIVVHISAKTKTNNLFLSYFQKCRPMVGDILDIVSLTEYQLKVDGDEISEPDLEFLRANDFIVTEIEVSGSDSERESEHYTVRGKFKLHHTK